MMIVLAKAHFHSQDYIKCFELLQRQYIENPSFTSLLYLYGKLVVKCFSKEIKQRQNTQ